MYICGLIPRNSAELAETVPIGDGSDLFQENSTEFEDDTEDACSACFLLTNSKPLSAKSFNIVQEWFF